MIDHASGLRLHVWRNGPFPYAADRHGRPDVGSPFWGSARPRRRRGDPDRLTMLRPVGAYLLVDIDGSRAGGRDRTTLRLTAT